MAVFARLRGVQNLAVFARQRGVIRSSAGCGKHELVDRWLLPTLLVPLGAQPCKVFIAI